MINNVLAIARGHKTFGVMWLFRHPATLQLSATVDTNASRSPKQFHTAKPLPPSVRDRQRHRNIEKQTIVKGQKNEILTRPESRHTLHTLLKPHKPTLEPKLYQRVQFFLLTFRHK